MYNYCTCVHPLNGASGCHICNPDDFQRIITKGPFGKIETIYYKPRPKPQPILEDELFEI